MYYNYKLRVYGMQSPLAATIPDMVWDNFPHVEEQIVSFSLRNPAAYVLFFQEKLPHGRRDRNDLIVAMNVYQNGYTILADITDKVLNPTSDTAERETVCNILSHQGNLSTVSIDEISAQFNSSEQF